MRTKSLFSALGISAASVLLAAAPAFAGNAHFIGNHTSASFSGFNLVVKFKEAGLESGSVETVTVTAHLDATVQCVNNGGSNPNDPKKTTVSGDFSESGEFTAAKNGSISGTLSLSPPSAGSLLSCPPGQKATMTTVAWSNITIEDETSGAFLALPGSFSAGTPID